MGNQQEKKFRFTLLFKSLKEASIKTCTPLSMEAIIQIQEGKVDVLITVLHILCQIDTSVQACAAQGWM